MASFTKNTMVTVADLPELSPTTTLSSMHSNASSVFSATSMDHSTPATSAPISRTTSTSCPYSSAATLSASVGPIEGVKPAPIQKGLPASQIETISPANYKAAAACLADAFAEDPLHAYLLNCPDTRHWSAARKWALHRRIFEFNVYINCVYGLVRGVRSPCSEELRYDAVAMWMPPGTDISLANARVLRLYAATQWQLSREGRRRLFKELFPLLHRTKAAVMGARDTKSWYLVYLGARKEAQGRGLGTRLVRDVTRQADAAGEACYLESSNACNVPLYERLGFETVCEIQCTRAEKDVGLDIMVREPVLVRET